MVNPKYDGAVAFITFQLNMFVHVCSDHISNHIGHGSDSSKGPQGP